MHRFPRFVTWLLLVACVTAARGGEQQAVPADHAQRVKEGLALFKQHVRPTLIKHCLECHGGKSTKADFDLATRKTLMASGYVEQRAADSHLLALITHAEEPHMPFKAARLPDGTIAQLRRWINLGAPYDQPLVERSGATPSAQQVTETDRQFWSFRPLQPGEPPVVENASWCRTAVDRFVLARQQPQGLRPNETAQRRVLIRRAFFDLLGLPPSPDQVQAFVGNDDPQAWPQLIDRLLESPHYGERWARHWMDVARFAESHGYEQDYNRPHAYHYRDFLIKAFNQDLPYDEFVRWQLAGDELAPDEPLALMATGFLGAGAFPTQLTEAEFESARYDELDDMVTTTGVAFLGLSIGCARCHDHKFDPIPARDYYRLAATFATTIRSEIELELEPEKSLARKAAWEARLQQLTSAVRDFEQQQLPARFRAWLAEYEPAQSLGPWETVKVVSVSSTGGTRWESLPDGSLLATGPTPDKEVVTVVAETGRPEIRAVRLEALTHATLPRQGPGRAPNGNFALGNFQITASPLPGQDKPIGVKLLAARATHQQDQGALSVAASIDDDPISGWAVDRGGIGKDQAAVFDLEQPVGFAAGTRLTCTLTFNHPNARHALGRLRLSIGERAELPPTVGDNGPDRRVAEALIEAKRTRDETSAAWQTAIRWYAGTLPEWQRLQHAVSEHRAAGPPVERTKVMVTSEGFPPMKHHADGRGFPHFYPETYFLQRGDVHQKQGVVRPGFLQVLTPPERDLASWNVQPPEGWSRTSFRRAALAHWIADPRQGAGQLAARVMVNRLWQHHFGRGIVATPNDFGFPGERPTHPRLLDWLAAQLIENGWRLKPMHRLIMTSSVYMQSGQWDETRAGIDRENTYLWRRASRRLDAETIRDTMLSISGQLDDRMFGPGTLDANMKRRSVYFLIKRSQLIPMMMLFDWPEHLVSIGQRSSTTIAPQALMFMNSPQGRAYATAFAGRVANEVPEEAVRTAYRLGVGREPGQAELRLAVAFLAQQAELYRAEGKSDAPRRALTDFCQTLMSGNEFVYVD